MIFHIQMAIKSGYTMFRHTQTIMALHTFSWLGSISISHSISIQLPTTSIKSPLSMVNPILPLASINPSTKCSYPRPRRGLPRSRHASAAIAVPPPATSQWCQDRGRPPEWSWHRHNFRTFFWDRNLSKLKTLQISLSRINFSGFFHNLSRIYRSNLIFLI